MFNRGDENLTQILGILKKIFKNDFIKIISKDSIDLRET
jgi:hypothetical protein